MRVAYMIFITFIACVISLFKNRIKENVPNIAYKMIPEMFLLLLLFAIRPVSPWSVVLWLMSGFECYSVWMIKEEKQLSAALFGIQIVFSVYAFMTKGVSVGMLEVVAAAYYFIIYSANFLSDKQQKRIKK